MLIGNVVNSLFIVPKTAVITTAVLSGLVRQLFC